MFSHPVRSVVEKRLPGRFYGQARGLAKVSRPFRLMPTKEVLLALSRLGATWVVLDLGRTGSIRLAESVKISTSTLESYPQDAPFGVILFSV